MADFVSGLWQIHAFGEGNTRTTAVFTINYLRSFGFDINNTLFAQHSWYFRNALVRANYSDLKNGIHATKEYVERFFRNLLLEENNALRNRDLLITKTPNNLLQSVKEPDNTISKSNICPLNCTLEECFVLEYLRNHPQATQKEMAVHIRKSERTVKSITSRLQQKKLLERQNGRRNGFWVVKEGH